MRVAVSAAGPLLRAAGPLARQQPARPHAPGFSGGLASRRCVSVAAAGAGKPLNKKDLVKLIAEDTELPEKTVEGVVSATIDTIIQQVSAGEKITLTGFGSFEAKTRKARVGRNPKTGEALQIAEKQYPAFSAGKTFKDTVAGP